MVKSAIHIENDKLREALWKVHDPEIPVLSVMDMGIVRGLQIKDDTVYVKITPTYSGCPAMDTIGQDIQRAIEYLGYEAKVELVLAPAWSTDWITEEGRKKLEDYGIAAPLGEQADKMALLHGAKIVKCTHCGSEDTQLVSQFGSTACKALFKCNNCLEPFDYFKCLK